LIEYYTHSNISRVIDRDFSQLDILLFFRLFFASYALFDCVDLMED